MSDITVTISDATQVVNQAGFGLCLIVSTTATHAYEEYDISEDLTSLVEDFVSNTEVYKIAETFALQDPRPLQVAVFGVDLSSSLQKAADLTAALNTLITTNNNWYRVILEDKTEALITAMSTWAESNSKMFYTQFGNTTFTTDFTVKTRTVLGYKENTDRLDVAMAGYAATRIPGSFTFKLKNLNGITADAITPAELETIHAKNMNAYMKKFEQQGLGSAQLDAGLVASGKHIDQIESRDWVKFRIQQEIAKLLTTSEKVPYNDDGIGQVVAAITVALNDAWKNGIIDNKKDKTPAFIVTYKAVADIPVADKAARKLTGVTFKYIELGAIEEVYVTGAVVLTLQEVKIDGSSTL